LVALAAVLADQCESLHRGGYCSFSVIQHRGTISQRHRSCVVIPSRRRRDMGGLIYLVGLIVIILFILSFLGLR
jgi:hypothetical protein